MAKTTSFALGKHFETFLQRQVKSGRYASASEVVREALRQFAHNEKRRVAWEAEIRKGFEDIARGDVFDADEVMAELVPARKRKAG